MQILPQIGTTGVWNVNTPFDSLLQPNTPYTLIAIRRISDILNAGGDPESDYYTKNALVSDNYLTDLANNVSILSLQSESSEVVFIPDSFITEYPDISGVPYRVLALTINLGAIPDSLSLSNVIAKVKSDVLELVGIDASAKLVALSPVNIISNADSKAIELARQANVGTVLTDYTRYVQTNAQLVSANQKIVLLEKMIKQLHESGVPLPVVTQ